MKVLVTGGAGYISRQILNVLNKNLNYKISVIDNLSTTKINYLKKKFNFQKLNILNMVYGIVLFSFIIY